MCYEQNITQVAVLNIDKWYSLSVVVHDLENNFRCNGSNFLSYRLLQSFQSLSYLSKVWYPTVNRFLIRNSLTSTKRKADTKRTLCCYRRPAIFYKLLNNKGSVFSQPRHGIHWKRHIHRCSKTCSSSLYALLTRSYAPPKLRCSFCRTLNHEYSKPSNNSRNHMAIKCCSSGLLITLKYQNGFADLDNISWKHRHTSMLHTVSVYVQRIKSRQTTSIVRKSSLNIQGN